MVKSHLKPGKANRPAFESSPKRKVKHKKAMLAISQEDDIVKHLSDHIVQVTHPDDLLNSSNTHDPTNPNVHYPPFNPHNASLSLNGSKPATPIKKVAAPTHDPLEWTIIPKSLDVSNTSTPNGFKATTTTDTISKNNKQPPKASQNDQPRDDSGNSSNGPKTAPAAEVTVNNTHHPLKTSNGSDLNGNIEKSSSNGLKTTAAATEKITHTFPNGSANGSTNQFANNQNSLAKPNDTHAIAEDLKATGVRANVNSSTNGAKKETTEASAGHPNQKGASARANDAKLHEILRKSKYLSPDYKPPPSRKATLQDLRGTSFKKQPNPELNPEVKKMMEQIEKKDIETSASIRPAPKGPPIRSLDHANQLPHRPMCCHVHHDPPSSAKVSNGSTATAGRQFTAEERATIADFLQFVENHREGTLPSLENNYGITEEDVLRYEQSLGDPEVTDDCDGRTTGCRCCRPEIATNFFDQIQCLSEDGKRLLAKTFVIQDGVRKMGEELKAVRRENSKLRFQLKMVNEGCCPQDKYPNPMPPPAGDQESDQVGDQESQPDWDVFYVAHDQLLKTYEQQYKVYEQHQKAYHQQMAQAGSKRPSPPLVRPPQPPTSALRSTIQKNTSAMRKPSNEKRETNGNHEKSNGSIARASRSPSSTPDKRVRFADNVVQKEASHAPITPASGGLQKTSTLVDFLEKEAATLRHEETLETPTRENGAVPESKLLANISNLARACEEGIFGEDSDSDTPGPLESKSAGPVKLPQNSIFEPVSVSTAVSVSSAPELNEVVAIKERMALAASQVRQNKEHVKTMQTEICNIETQMKLAESAVQKEQKDHRKKGGYMADALRMKMEDAVSRANEAKKKYEKRIGFKSNFDFALAQKEETKATKPASGASDADIKHSIVNPFAPDDIFGGGLCGQKASSSKEPIVFTGSKQGESSSKPATASGDPGAPVQLNAQWFTATNERELASKTLSFATSLKQNATSSTELKTAPFHTSNIATASAITGQSTTSTPEPKAAAKGKGKGKEPAKPATDKGSSSPEYATLDENGIFVVLPDDFDVSGLMDTQHDHIPTCPHYKGGQPTAGPSSAGAPNNTPTKKQASQAPKAGPSAANRDSGTVTKPPTREKPKCCML